MPAVRQEGAHAQSRNKEHGHSHYQERVPTSEVGGRIAQDANPQEDAPWSTQPPQGEAKASAGTGEHQGREELQGPPIDSSGHVQKWMNQTGQKEEQPTPEPERQDLHATTSPAMETEKPEPHIPGWWTRCSGDA